MGIQKLLPLLSTSRSLKIESKDMTRAGIFCERDSVLSYTAISLTLMRFCNTHVDCTATDASTLL